MRFRATAIRSRSKAKCNMIKKASGIFLLYLLKSTLCIPLNDFYEFGGNTVEPNQRIGDGNSGTSGEVFTDNFYHFYGQAEFAITVSRLSIQCR